MIRNIPWWHPEMGEEEKNALAKVIDSNFPNHGVYTVEFEKRLARLCKADYAVAVTSGTAALFLALCAAGVGFGDEVIIPDITFIATANAVSLTGAKAVLVDVYSEDLTIDISKISNAITPKTKAVIPVHLSGRSAKVELLDELCRSNNLALIHDAAEALGSCNDIKPISSFGFASCLSFTATKLITTGQGGVVVMNDERVYQKIRALRDHGRPGRGTGGNDIHDTIGFNFKFTDLQAAVGLAQLDTLERRLLNQKQMYSMYKDQLAGLTSLRLLPFNLSGGESPLWIDAIAKDRDKLVKFLKEHGVETRNFWHPIHTQKPYSASEEFYPVATNAGKEALWLPSALSLTSEDINYVTSKIKGFYNE